MRLLLMVFLTTGINSSLLACFCAPHPFCKHLENIENIETAFVFKGAYIQEESLDFGTKAVQLKIEKVYSGEVIKPDSPHYNDEFYTNTDSTVWVLSGGSDACLRIIHESSAIFALTYNGGWLSPHDLVGYVPSTCYSDYFPIAEDQTINGYIWLGDNVTMELADFEELITTSCNTITSIDNASSITNQIKVYPNPIVDILNIQIDNNKDSWTFNLFDKTGNNLGLLDNDSVDMSNLMPGVYFLCFSNGSASGVKKIVKI